MTEQLADIGLVGLAVMGGNLARNMARNGYTVAVWNRDPARVDKFMATAGPDKKFIPTRTPQDLVAALARPRKIMLLVKAGEATDWTIAQLKPYLEPGDILIDGGNALYHDTIRREKALKAEGLHFIGCGVSGGEEGALLGPSLMPGGDRDAYEQLRPIWEAIAAKVDDGPCVTYIGPNGAGHFVKMVHNGIEYGDMQLIAEAYDLLKRVGRLTAPELGVVFAAWNEGVLQSFLIEITAQIFRAVDPETQQPLVDLILDKAGQKGTGKWTSEAALELGVPVPTIQAAIDARLLSAMKAERVAASQVIVGPPTSPEMPDLKDFIILVHNALYASKICSYAQGMALLAAASRAYDWNLNLSEISRIWKGGCIIRAQFLDKIKQAYQRRPDLPNLLLDPDFNQWMADTQTSWRTVVSIGALAGIPLPAMSASLAYFDSYRTATLPQNLTQAQRDFFGSHTYERLDKPEAGPIHTDWKALVR
ncbi:MAG: NADP-dependent phosphogluconate dehydrogenase [Chloracidobacterium sp.]|nr:NADP-dependent phosphogluconate dehydrogenase [Chloracidobacterium sp.]MDW8217001.1 NADP-dependent phosphogluconate dehydrogenase [Acidobacteriota bacterium]